jgi:hypothetical protein
VAAVIDGVAADEPAAPTSMGWSGTVALPPHAATAATIAASNATWAVLLGARTNQSRLATNLVGHAS